MPSSPPSHRGLRPNSSRVFEAAFEQQAVDEGGIALGDGIELVRQGEYDMPVRDVEQIGALALDPSGLRQRLALGAVTIAARGVLNRHRPAVVAVRFEPEARADAVVAVYGLLDCERAPATAARVTKLIEALGGGGRERKRRGRERDTGR